jgi:probable blue pigment (indigoidine) exporter
MTGEATRDRAPADIAMTALAPLAWGTTYLVTSELLPDDRPLLAGALRALPAGVTLAIVGRVAPTGIWWWRSFVLGTLNIGAFFALLFTAAYRLPGGVAAALGGIQPLVAAGLAALLLRERPQPVVLAASVAAVVGVALVTLRATAHLDGWGVAAALGGAASMATGVVLTKRWGQPVPLLTFTSWQLIAGGIILLPLALVTEDLPATITWRNVAGYAWLATAGGAIAYSLWFRGIARLPVASTSLLGTLSPVTAALLGWTVAGQSLSQPQILGIVLVIGSVVVAQRAVASHPPVSEHRDRAAWSAAAHRDASARRQ